MKAIIQRVNNAFVSVNKKTVGTINNGLSVLLGVGKNDTESDAEWLLNKIINMRIFGDSNGKFNYSLLDIDGNLLVISQFTLFANCKKGNRPSFIEAANPKDAKILYDYFIQISKHKLGNKVQTGVFAANMELNLVNDGPVTIILDSAL